MQTSFLLTLLLLLCAACDAAYQSPATSRPAQIHQPVASAKKCSGSATPCSYYLGVCVAQDGCYQPGGSHVCGGFATSCSVFTTEYSCLDQEGCDWR